MAGQKNHAGVNQMGVRAHNEKLILTLLRRHGSHSNADIARYTGLSAQTISVINRKLQTDHLIKKEDRVKGRVGQPSIPMTLDPDGAFSIGLRIGRRSANLALMDFVGSVRHQIHTTYQYPTPDLIKEFVSINLQELLSELDSSLRHRVIGIGVGSPFELWNWFDRLGAPSAEMSKWQDFNLAGELSTITGLDVTIENDASCACLAEQMIGQGRNAKDFAYFYIGSFVGGGIVLNHKLITGVNGNGGAFGSLPLQKIGGKKDEQLIDNASLYVLERSIQEQGHDASALWSISDSWDKFDVEVSEWIKTTSKALSHAIASVCAVIDFPIIVIDGAMPPLVRQKLVQSVKTDFAVENTQGLLEPEILEGQAGQLARTIGASLLPISSRFLLEAPDFDIAV